MQQKNKPDKRGFVYSTNPDFQFEHDLPHEQTTPQPANQKLRIRLDTKQRAGKSVTLVEGFVGSINDLEQLGKQLKNLCGTGGSVKDNQILIQGDQREKMFQWLLKHGFTQSKKL